MAEPVEQLRDPRPLDAVEQVIYDALHADVWTTPKPRMGPEWHLRFPHWLAVHGARLAATALSEAALIASTTPEETS